MKKTAAQLDAEIAESLAGEHYYVVLDRRGGHRTIYGPFETLKDAEYAGYFAKPVSERDSQPANIYFMRGVQRYNADEIKYLRDYPEENELKSVQLKRGAPPVHPSWRVFDKTDKTFRHDLRDKDYEIYQHIVTRR